MPRTSSRGSSDTVVMWSSARRQDPCHRCSTATTSACFVRVGVQQLCESQPSTVGDLLEGDRGDAVLGEERVGGAGRGAFARRFAGAGKR